MIEGSVKIIKGRTIGILLALFCLLLAFFFLLRAMGSHNRGTIPKSRAEEQKFIKELEVQAGFVLSEDVELLEYMDDKARDGSKGYFTWGLFSPTAITTMPVIKESYINGYLKYSSEDSLDTNVKFIQIMTGKRKIEQPQSAFDSYWKVNGYEFSGTVVRTPEGDYMRVERFWIGGTPPQSQKTENPPSAELQISHDLLKTNE